MNPRIVADTLTFSRYPSRFRDKFWKVSSWDLNWAAGDVRPMVAKLHLLTMKRLAMSAIDSSLYISQKGSNGFTIVDS
jgi:hypothetical protein